MRRLRALMRKELTHMRRDPRTVVIIFLMPILQLLLLGYATDTNVRNVPTVVLDQDGSRQSRALLDAYSASGYFSLDLVAYSQTEVTDIIEKGQARAAIIIPPNYGSDLVGGRVPEVAVLIDGADPTVASTALSTATLVGQAHANRVLLQTLKARGIAGLASAPLDVRTRVLYNPDMQSSYNMVPGLIALILMMTTSMLTSLSIVKEREQGTIEQLIVTPIRSWELVVAKITPYAVVSIINVIFILMLGTLWFHVPIRGSFLLLFSLTGLFLLPNLGIGLLISSIARTQQQAQFMVMPIMLPSMMLSGFIFPIAALPPFLRLVSNFLPITYFLVIARSVVIKGATIGYLIPQVIALCIFSVLLLAIAALRFRKTLD
jgi:ABC-2 type transport system permease protein